MWPACECWRARKADMRYGLTSTLGAIFNKRMRDILRFIVLPAIVILGAAWLAVLKHRLSMLLPFLIAMGVLMALLRVIVGFSPLAYFVSFGGYLWLAAVAWIAAAIVRKVSGAIRSNRLR